jgi:hypothetical protein
MTAHHTGQIRTQVIRIEVIRVEPRGSAP